MSEYFKSFDGMTGSEEKKEYQKGTFLYFYEDSNSLIIFSVSQKMFQKTSQEIPHDMQIVFMP